MLSEIELQSNSYLFGGNAPYVEELYELYLDNPGSVPDRWRDYFDQLQHLPASDGLEATRDQAHAPIVESFAQRARNNGFVARAQEPDLAVAGRQVHVQTIIAAYRSMGSRLADLDPLKRQDRPVIPELDPSSYGMLESDLDQVYSATNTYFTKADTMTMRDIIKALRDTYCRSVGAEFMYITDPAAKRWIQERLESTLGVPSYSNERKRYILRQVTEAEGLERFLHTKYVGQKRFSLEGGESFIAAMDEVVGHAGDSGVQELVVGMAHRGRLNLLVNIMGKMPADLFAEFEGKHAEGLTDGDVKYHNGFSSDLSTRGGPVHLSLAFNPSHLEIVNPVVEGSVRARQDRRGDDKGVQVLPVLVHGDAAFAGQGVIMETLNLAQTRGFGTGGTDAGQCRAPIIWSLRFDQGIDALQFHFASGHFLRISHRCVLRGDTRLRNLRLQCEQLFSVRQDLQSLGIDSLRLVELLGVQRDLRLRGESGVDFTEQFLRSRITWVLDLHLVDKIQRTAITARCSDNKLLRGNQLGGAAVPQVDQFVRVATQMIPTKHPPCAERKQQHDDASDDKWQRLAFLSRPRRYRRARRRRAQRWRWRTRRGRATHNRIA